MSDAQKPSTPGVEVGSEIFMLVDGATVDKAQATYSADTIGNYKGNSTLRGLFYEPLLPCQWVCIAADFLGELCLQAHLVAVCPASEWKQPTRAYTGGQPFSLCATLVP